jgi:alpha/beta superfamily hydrolase
MAPDRLPPPPAVPVRSPPASVAGEIEVRVQVPGGPSLEARVHAPPHAVRAVVLCHPHPLYGGSMHSPVPLALAKYLAEVASEQVAWARFNFRGVGSSEGVYGNGAGEVDDACAVLAHMRAMAPGALATICGHSFGSAVALLAAARDGGVDRVLLLAPSVRLFGLADIPRGLAAKCTIFVGDRDELFGVDGAWELAHEIGATLRVFDGFDHHFLKSRRALAMAALPVIAPEVSHP